MEQGGGRTSIRVGRGPREVEAQLLEEVAAAVAAAELHALTRPLRVVVPSDSLRRHLAAALVRHVGHAVVGVQVQTLYAVALDVLDRAEEPGLRNDDLLPVLVRRLARAEPVLRSGLDDLVDGYRAVTAAVTDLLDAGIRPEHGDPLREAIAECAGDTASARRAAAVVEVAIRTRALLASAAPGHAALVFERARELLQDDPAAALPARGVWIHGFAEATGLRSEFLEALVRCSGARVFLDEPPDPAGEREQGVRRVFSDRLRQRLAGVAPIATLPAPAPPAPALTALQAPGGQAEVRAVAERIRQALEGDPALRPESIGVVCRDIGRYRAAIREQFRRLGIPFSGVRATGSVGATWRRVQALLDLLAAGGRTPTDRWLDAALHLGTGDDPAARADLRLALRHVAAVRLADVAARPERVGALRLPAVGAWRDAEDGGEVAGARRRTLPAAVHAAAVAAAARVLQRLARLERAAGLGRRLDALCELLRDGLGWEREAPGCAPVYERLDALREALPADLSLEQDDFQLLLRRALADVGSEPIGGAGGGVQVLDVMEARARTFARLFVMGLNRDVFPRSVQPDPLLPDALRRALAVILPDLPIKSTGYDEDRYLFAQLVESSPEVVLSWQTVTDDGAECAPSTFVERLHWSPRALEAATAPPVAARPGAARDPAAPPALRTAAEAALRAGLFGGRDAFAQALQLAWEELDRDRDELARGGAEAVARGRLAVLAELDPERRPPDLGPYFGFAGGATAGDPRRGPLYVTTAEGIARCPWQAFLERALRLEAPPDPLEALPGGDARLLGSVVHAVLEGLARDAGPGSRVDLATAAGRTPVAIAWPAEAELRRRAVEAAGAVLADEGIALSGLARVLAGQARPYLEAARQRAFGDAAVLAVEVDGTWDRGAGRRPVRFRADRVDAVDGQLLLTDYKTGKPISDHVGEATRRRKLVEAVGRGASLQAAVYARAAGVAGGRFLFLGPDVSPDAAEFAVARDDEDVAAALEAACSAIEGAWDAGVSFPRLVEADLQREPSACSYCNLTTACLRGDSGARQRLVEWVEAPPSGAGPVEAPFLALWNLHRAQGAR